MSLDGAVRKDGEGSTTKTHPIADMKAPAPSVAAGGQIKPFNGEIFDKNNLARGLSLTPQNLSINRERPSLSHIRSENTNLAVRSPLGSGECPNDTIDRDPTILNGQVTDTKRTTELENRKTKQKGKITDASANTVKEFLMLDCMRFPLREELRYVDIQYYLAMRYSAH